VSVEAARAILEATIPVFEGDRAHGILTRVLAELVTESPAEAARRYERERKRDQRAAKKRPPDTPPVPELSRTGPDVSPIVPGHVPVGSRALPSLDLLPASSPSEPLSLLNGEAKTGRGRATSMPDPGDTAAFEAFARRWSLPIVPGMSGTSPHPEARGFVDHHRGKGTTFKDWAAAWRTWLRRAPGFNGGGGRANGPARVQPAPPGPSRYKLGDGE
jgi:hypothetical protein